MWFLVAIALSNVLNSRQSCKPSHRGVQVALLCRPFPSFDTGAIPIKILYIEQLCVGYNITPNV
jgi:hypothetical protein